MNAAQPPRTPLASVDAAWLHMDDPTNVMVITIAMFFDACLDYQQLRTTVAERLLPFERFRQRIVRGRDDKPHWEADPHFILDAHLHRYGLPGAGGEAELRALISELISTPLDLTRPLWKFFLIEHYGTGCALVLRIHHCMADGMALIEIFNAFLDRPIDAPTASNAAPAAAPSGPFSQAVASINTALRTTEQIIQRGWGWISRPERALSLLGSGAAAVGKLALMGPDAHSILKGPLSGVKRAAWAETVPLSAIKAVSNVLGGTVNDVLLTAISGALRRYMDAHGAEISPRGLRAIVPVNLLPPGAKPNGGNNFGLVHVTLPVGSDDPVERSARLRREMDAIKASPEAYIGYGALSILGNLPADVEQALVDVLSTMASMVITNVPGPRQSNSLMGHNVARAMFWVPEASRISLGISILSYAGNVQVAIVSDVQTLADPGALGAAIDAEFAELFELARAVEEE
ncbi:MAG: wax ester/triacylglycerol synthase family O-acyltransferase [Candidatus Viridilinea halotolerans]|uniref:diacylglycerol O-acyltransferase n=1 Tax=Candidatus Viridilinea halotolerans TaxID=2491704 RepID=A0A426TU18_9CHLR|nr:MAG: wax ester/triacylglycerol synthase family O-acyltransferase [Candidatus Viridilinea halotolerans]